MLYKLQLGLSTVRPEQNEDLLKAGLGMNAVMAAGIIQSIPVFIMFIIFREQLMRGIKLRGFK